MGTVKAVILLMPVRLRAAVVVLALGGAAALAGCNGPGVTEASGVATSFDQLAKADAAKACQLLSEQTRHKVEKDSKAPCDQALGNEDLPEASAVRVVDVYGHDARVVLEQDTVFLARFPDGWKVTAAGCKPAADPDQPYECAISGV